MAEPTSTAAAASSLISTGAITFASLQHGIDGDALIGSFAGAAIFAVHSVEIPVFKRLIYIPVSVALGYLFSPVVNTIQSEYTGVDSIVVCSFVVSAVIVTLSQIVLDGLWKFEFSDIFSFLKSKKGERK